MKLLWFKHQRLTYYKLVVLNSFLLLLSPSLFANEQVLSLSNAIELAQRNDPWLIGNHHKQQSLESTAIAAGTLPDPRVLIGIVNIAADSLDFDQENMTQFKVGVSQVFPRGDTLALRTEKFQLLSGQNPYLRDDRKLQVSVAVAEIWFNIFHAKESLRLIENNRSLFEQLVEISEASYASAFGSTQQQDIVRAELELTRLDDRLTQLKRQQESGQKLLSKWVSGQFTKQYHHTSTTEAIDSSSLPQQLLHLSELIHTKVSTERLTTLFLQHPAVAAVDSLIAVSHTDIKLAKQQYKPQWGVNAAYGYRADGSMNDRSDLLSIGVSFDVPLFSEHKQDKQLQASISEAESTKTQKWLLLRKMLSDFNSFKASLLRLNERHTLYQQKLLPQMYAQAEAALSAYTNDEGDFAEVVRARIDVLNAEIDSLTIEVDRQKTISQLNYFLSPMSTDGADW
jgi:outer membrane protein TolC